MSTTKKMLQARFARSEVERIEDWRRAQPQIPNVADAVRALVFRGLSMCEIDEQRAGMNPTA
jgi:hypothetical protein